MSRVMGASSVAFAASAGMPVDEPCKVAAKRTFGWWRLKAALSASMSACMPSLPMM